MFSQFRDNLKRHFGQHFAVGLVYQAAVTPEELWDTYLKAFGDEPIYRTKPVHDCNCCRRFIRDVGAMVVIRGDKLVSLWDFDAGDPQYQAVADAMAELVKSRGIEGVFVGSKNEPEIGTLTNRRLKEGEALEVFHHFHLKLPSTMLSAQPDRDRGEFKTTYQMFERALTELRLSAIDEVLDLIASNSLYRGEEHKDKLVKFRKHLMEFGKLPLSKFAELPLSRERIQYIWDKIKSPVARIRNSAIGTLLVDLSEGKDLELAVKAFETMVAPSNYQRPKSLVTAKMVADAKATVEGLGLLTALDRRYAALTDVSVNNVLFADRSARAVMKDADPFDSLANKGTTPNFDRIDSISIDKFLTDVLPRTETLEVYFEGEHSGRLVSLVTATNLDALPLFKWDNPFSWSYNGDVADSIKERVKRAGGNVVGEICCRLAWNNYDDLDLHMLQPDGELVFFGNKRGRHGQLDVDMNAGGGQTRTPVENIFYPRIKGMPEGKYKLKVNQYNRREGAQRTYTVEVDILGSIVTFEGINPFGNKTDEICTIQVKDGKAEVVGKTGSRVSRELWGLGTEKFHRVNALLLSPNHWEGEKGIGNKHYFFMIDGCVNEDNARGFYNEFLRPDLTPHRRVLEILGGKQRTAETPDQLSGLGFSSTMPGSVVVRVSGSVSRVMKVTF